MLLKNIWHARITFDINIFLNVLVIRQVDAMSERKEIEHIE